MTSSVVQLRRTDPGGKQSEQIVREAIANELVFAVVGPVGSGTSTVARRLKAALEAEHLPGGPFDVELLKATDVIHLWAERNKKPVSMEKRNDIERVHALQDLGDEMRKRDHAAVATAMVGRIRAARARGMGIPLEARKPVAPDQRRRAYILDALRHPAEALLLRNIYQTAFTMVGVVCDEGERRKRLTKKFSNAGETLAQELMDRDAKAPEKHGQRVEDTFELSDFFVDNTIRQWSDDEQKSSNKNWDVPEQLRRLIKTVTHSEIVRPTTAETAMYAASGAQRRSACLSRQVGAALVDREGNVVSVGTNEVPRAGGGVYGQGFPEADSPDERCAYRSRDDKRYCSNTREQSLIVDKLLDLIEKELGADALSPERRAALTERLQRSPIGALIEFSRAVHAEMDALLAAARKGVPLCGTRMFVTTYPCHSCARHLVAAGVDEVQYIEAYQKSKARELHEDSITIDRSSWTRPPSRGGAQVLFRPFTGVAPRLYARAFLKDRDLKDSRTGDLKLGEPHWSGPWDISRVSYTQIEADLDSEV